MEPDSESKPDIRQYNLTEEKSMKRFTYTVSDPQGLHARNAISLCRLAGTFKAQTLIHVQELSLIHISCAESIWGRFPGTGQSIDGLICLLYTLL